MIKRIGILGITLPLMVIAVLLSACGGSSSSSSSGATGTVQGNLASFSAFHDRMMQPPRIDDAQMPGFVTRSVLAPAHAQSGGIGGVNVTVAGISTQTSPSGNFRVDRVPAGQRVVTFSGGGVSGSTTVNVVAGSTVNMINIIVNNGSARPTTVSVAGGGSRSDDDSSDDFSDDDSSDDFSDDDSSDDDSSDDDSSDDDSSDD
jgi:hypothetical protein